jgi:hypothetical protein
MNNISLEYIIKSMSIDYGLSKDELFHICYDLFSIGISNKDNIHNSILIYIEKVNKGWKFKDIYKYIYYVNTGRIKRVNK